MATANEVLDLSATEALAWFQPFTEDESLPADFNWHLLAECIVTQARNEILESDSLVWAWISTTIYDRLARHAPDASFDVSSMYCRIAMIGRHGIRENDTILDPSVGMNWFRRSALQMSEINALLIRLDSEPHASIVVDVLRPLRRLKNHLKVIEQLTKHVDVPADIVAYGSSSVSWWSQ